MEKKNFIKKKIRITKINFLGVNKSGQCRNSVEAELSLSEDNCFSASAYLWNDNHNGVYMGGQCFDILKEIPEVTELPIFQEIYDLWNKYHLNDLRAGTKAQEEILKEAIRNGELKACGANSYDKSCAYLESKDMLYDKNYLVEKVPYKYGSGWLKEEIPEKDLLRIRSLIQTGKIYDSKTLAHF